MSKFSLEQRVKQLEADNLVMRKFLDRIASYCEHVEEVPELCQCSDEMTGDAKEALAKTSHTAALSEYVRALEAVAEQTKRLDELRNMPIPNDWVGVVGKRVTFLNEALTKLESAASNYKNLKIPKTEKE